MDKINKILLAIILFYILLCNTSCSYNNINYDRLPDSYNVETDYPYTVSYTHLDVYKRQL